MNVVPYGSHAVLVEYDSLDAVIAAAAILRAAHLDGVEDIVPAARTVLVRYSSRPAGLDVALAETAGGALTNDSAVSAQPGDGGLTEMVIEIPVTYDGADLGAVAAMTGLDAAGVVDVHSAPTYTSVFCGFTPGFAYLTGLPKVLQLPRRDTPRVVVPAGSLAIAAEFTAVYPSRSPGGWHLLGHTDAVLFDVARAAPALLAPGTRVRFVAR